MRRFFIPHIEISKKEIIISDPTQIHHIKDVLRFKPKDKILIFDEAGNEYECLIKSLDSKKIVVTGMILRNKIIDNSAAIEICLACAIPKKGKFDTIVEKTTELGIDRIIPMETHNSIVRLSDIAKTKKHARWQRIAIEASKQCRRPGVPNVEAPKKYQDVVNIFDEFDSILLPNLSSQNRIPIIDAVQEIKNAHKVLLLIGPEGDFNEPEIQKACEHKANMVTLGKTVLKVETAAIVCSGLLCMCLKETK